MKIKKDMMVKVVSGNFKGMTGKVLKVIPHSQRAIVEGVALTKEQYVLLKRIHKEVFQKEKDRYIFLI